MDNNRISNFFSSKRVLQVLFFVAAVALITYFFPRDKKFSYTFQEGRPWKYDLLTAPFNFPIYKDDEVFKHELDSIERNFRPAFIQDDEIAHQAIQGFKTELDNYTRQNFIANIFYPTKENEVWVERLKQAYLGRGGIIDSKKLKELKADSTQQIRIIQPNNTYLPRPIETLQSPEEAYLAILNNTIDNADMTMLEACHLKDYIKPNIIFDSITTAKLKENEMKWPQAIGAIQAGERIVDRGEIVTPQIYRILKSLEKVTLEKKSESTHKGYSLAGLVIVISCLFLFFYLFLAFFRSRTFNSPRTLGFIMMLIVSISIISFWVTQWRELSIYLVPFTIIPIILVTFFDSRTALFSHLIIVLICAFTAPFPLEFVFLQLMAGMTAIDSLNDLSRRSQLMRSALLVFFTYSFTYIGYTLLTEGAFTKLTHTQFIYFGVNGILLLFAYLLIYIFEKLFKFTSTVTLVELSDVNNPILRQLSEECPGTFQHSLQISNLAAEAANKIGAKAQLVRTGALYHDIGKLKNPAFFTENQSGFNPHKPLTFEQSAQIIISHVSDGLKAADKLRLPQVIKDFIATHHGKGKAKYFYNSYRNQYPDQPIDEAKFTYPGPNPFTKETGILMMADAVEAASRSLKEYTNETISELVNRIIDSQIADGLLRDTPLSFRDVEVIKATFIEKLKTIYHTRISYPELNKKALEENADDKTAPNK